MPLYPYRCTQCGHRFEKIQRFSAEPVKVCPKCGGPVERVLTAPGLQFKGAGWYVNDYAPKSSGTKTESADSPGAAPAESKGEGKAESKTGTKPATSSGGESNASSTSSASSSPGASSGSAPSSTPGSTTT